MMAVKRKKTKETKKALIKCILMYKNYKDCLFNNKTILKKQQRFKSDYHEVYTEEVNKTPLSSKDNNRLQTFDWIKSYPHGTNAFSVKVWTQDDDIKKTFLLKNTQIAVLWWNSIKTTKIGVF